MKAEAADDHLLILPPQRSGSCQENSICFFPPAAASLLTFIGNPV